MFFELPKDLRDVIWRHVKQMREQEERQKILNMEWKIYMWLYHVHLRIMDAGYERCGL
jgi:hypothetical protein